MLLQTKPDLKPNFLFLQAASALGVGAGAPGSCGTGRLRARSLSRPGAFYSALKEIGRAVRMHIPGCDCQNSGRYIAPLQTTSLNWSQTSSGVPVPPAQPRGPSSPPKAETSALKETQNIQPSSLSPMLARAICPQKKTKERGEYTPPKWGKSF